MTSICQQNSRLQSARNPKFQLVVSI